MKRSISYGEKTVRRAPHPEKPRRNRRRKPSPPPERVNRWQILNQLYDGD